VLDIVKSPVAVAPGGGVPGMARWELGSHYQYRSDRHELTRVVDRVEEAHRTSFDRGIAEFALVLEGPLLLFCSRFGEALPWSGSSYLWHRLPRAERTLPSSGAAESGVPMEVSLIDSRDGHVAAARVVTLPATFARVLHEAILEQVRFSFDPCAERRALQGLQRRCPNARALVAYATVRAVAE
jgi:hypothetical protein